MKKIKYNAVTNAGNIESQTGKLFEIGDYQFAIDENNNVTELSTGACVFKEVHNINIIIYTEEQVIEKVKLKILDRDKLNKAIDDCREVLKIMGLSFPINERY